MFDARRLFAALRRPAPPQTPYALGQIALDAGRPQEALVAFAAAASCAPSAPARALAHNKCGVAAIALGRPGDALDAFETALACDERCAPALVNLGNLLLEDGDALDAIDYYRAALRYDEKYALAQRNLGIALKALGERSAAVRALRTAARLEGRRPR